MKKNKIFKLFILLSVLIFTGCYHTFKRPSYTTYISTNIYSIFEKNIQNRMEISQDDAYKMNEIIREKYGISFYRYNRINAPKVVNKDYDSKTQFAQRQYIHFFDDIKLIIGEKEFIIAKEDISELIGHDGPSYIYQEPIDFERSKYNDIIVDLGEIEIYDENGKIQRKRRKVPILVMKKKYCTIRCNNFMCTSKDTLYDGWAEDYPEELKKLQGIKD